MYAAPNSVREWPAASPETRRARPAAFARSHETLRVDCVGYLVPTLEFDAVVHSVFARACNIELGGDLLTIVAHDLGDGPATLRLAPAAVTDFRLVARAGERWRCRDGAVIAHHLAFDLTNATVWRPAPLRACIDAPELGVRLRFTVDALASWRPSHSSIVDREGGALLAGLRETCRRLDLDGAARHVATLAGWGEGLTPAGDDVLVGLRAALGAQVGGREDRAHFLLELSAAMIAQAHRTTPVAAHYLRFAARGHFNADVVRLLDALLGVRGTPDLAPALFAALDNGATSGADMVTGVIVGLTAWLGVGTGANAGGVPPGHSALASPMQ